MADACTVVIGAPDLLPSLKQRTPAGADEVLAFSDADALRALEIISQRRPRMVALERVFAATPRGAALINRIRADPSLADAEIRVLSHDGDYTRVLPRGVAATTSRSSAAPSGTSGTLATSTQPGVTTTTAPLVLDRGTRRAARHRMAPELEVVVDGNPATLVDLSVVGAQVVSVTILRPNQRVRVALADEFGVIRVNAAVAWAAFEIPAKPGPQYRAGIEFIEADGPALEAFCDRHRAR